MYFVIVPASLCTVFPCMYMKHVSTMSQLLETTMTYAGDVRDYENCNAAIRNIDPDCNLFYFSNTKYYLEDDINEIIKKKSSQ